MYAYPRFARFPMIVPLERLRKWVSLNRLKSVHNRDCSVNVGPTLLENSLTVGVSKVVIF